MSTGQPQGMRLQERITSTAFAFRGYNTTNLGRSHELLRHPTYGAVVERWLREASASAGRCLGRDVDLLSVVRNQRECSLATYEEDIALIVAMQLAQLELLEQCFGVRYQSAKLGCGYSLGEITALIAGGVLTMEDALKIPLTMAADCAALAADVVLGVLFSRGPLLDLLAVERLCLEINALGAGVIGISCYLSPNSLLLMGQARSMDLFAQRMYEVLPREVHLRRNEHRWPPLHTPIVWQRNIANRAGVLLHTLPVALRAPSPPVLSMVTGKCSYNSLNGRDLLSRWVDHPQRLWDVVYEMLAQGVTTVIHVGPEPNLMPATITRLGANVRAQLAQRSLGGFGLRAVSRAAQRPWLARLLPTRSALLRAPSVQQIILDDWLLEQKPTDG